MMYFNIDLKNEKPPIHPPSSLADNNASSGQQDGVDYAKEKGDVLFDVRERLINLRVSTPPEIGPLNIEKRAEKPLLNFVNDLEFS